MGAHDPASSFRLAEALHKAAGDGAKKMWVETDHFFQGVDRYAILEDVIAFMLDNMRAEQRPEPAQ